MTLEYFILGACVLLTIGVLVLAFQTIRLARHVMIMEELVGAVISVDDNDRP